MNLNYNNPFKVVRVSDLKNKKYEYSKPILLSDINKVGFLSEQNNVDVNISVSNVKFLYNYYTKEYEYNYLSSDRIVIPFISDKILSNDHWQDFISKIIDNKVFPIDVFSVLYYGNKAYFCFKIDRVLFENYNGDEVYTKSKRYFKKVIENIVSSFNFNFRKIYQDGIVSNWEKLHIHICESQAKNLKLEIPLFNTYKMCGEYKFKVERLLFSDAKMYTLDEIIKITKNVYKEKFIRNNFDNCSKEVKFSHLKRAKDIYEVAKLMSISNLENLKTYTLLLHAGRNAVNGGLNKRGVLKEIKKVNDLLCENGFILSKKFLENIYEKSIQFEQDIPKLTDLKEKAIFEINKLDINNELNIFNAKRGFLTKNEIKLLAINIVYNILHKNNCINLDPNTKDNYGVSIRRLSRVFGVSWNFVKKAITLDDETIDSMFVKYENENGINKKNIESLIKDVNIKVDNRYIKYSETKEFNNYIKNSQNDKLTKIIKKGLLKYKNDYKDYIDKENSKYLERTLNEFKTYIHDNQRRIVDLLNYSEKHGNKVETIVKELILSKFIYPTMKNLYLDDDLKNDLETFYDKFNKNFFKGIKFLISILLKYMDKNSIDNKFIKIKKDVIHFMQLIRSKNITSTKEYKKRIIANDSYEYSDFKEKVIYNLYLAINKAC